MNRIAVLGGGVSGVVMAKRLADKGTDAVDLIEQEERLGGLHRSIRVENLTFDIGAFLFSQEHELLKSFPTLYDCFVPVQDTSPQHLEMLRADFETHADALSLCEPDVPLQYLGSVVTERAYPLFQRGKSQELQAERDRLTAAGIDFVGRQGNFAYLSSHAAAQQAACLAATID